VHWIPPDAGGLRILAEAAEVHIEAHPGLAKPSLRHGVDRVTLPGQDGRGPVPGLVSPALTDRIPSRKPQLTQKYGEVLPMESEVGRS
jgi:hypothetical protein